MLSRIVGSYFSDNVQNSPPQEEGVSAKKAGVSFRTAGVAVGAIAVGLAALSCYWISSQGSDDEESSSQLATTTQEIANIAGDCILAGTVMMQNFLMFGAAYRLQQEQQMRQFEQFPASEISDSFFSEDSPDLETSLEQKEIAHVEKKPQMQRSLPKEISDCICPDLLDRETVWNLLVALAYPEEEKLQIQQSPVNETPDCVCPNLDLETLTKIYSVFLKEQIQQLESEIQQKKQPFFGNGRIPDCISSEDCPDLDLETLLEQKKIKLEFIKSPEFEAFVNQMIQKVPGYLDCSKEKEHFFAEGSPKQSIANERKKCIKENLDYLSRNNFENLLDKSANQLQAVKENLEILRCRKDDPREKVLYAVANISSIMEKSALSPLYSNILYPLSLKYDVRYQAVSDYEPLCEAIKSVAQTGTLSEIYIDGHGERTVLQLGDREEQAIYYLDKFPDCFSNLKKDGKIILVSCETGAPGFLNLAQRMANSLRRVVVASRDALYDRNLWLLPDGSIYHPQEKDPTKNAFSVFYPIIRASE